MNYVQAVDFLYERLPMFQRVGQSAYRIDLHNIKALAAAWEHPENGFKSIHVAGTNGKGSVSHMLSAILQSAGYKVGLYTSPHLKSFTERIRVNGKEIRQEKVVEYVERSMALVEEYAPSFFELTTLMAFQYFKEEAVDIAIVEVGLGGRLDSTNIITPELSIITSIGLDHKEFLGDTHEKVAFEKAGIIKESVPVVTGEKREEVRKVMQHVAMERKAELTESFANFEARWDTTAAPWEMRIIEDGIEWAQSLALDLEGTYQEHNVPVVLAAWRQLQKQGWKIAERNLRAGFASVSSLSGLKGRWQILQKAPLMICDTGHNPEAFHFLLPQLQKLPKKDLWMILGMVKDKDIQEVLQMMPKEAHYVFTQSTVPRALPAAELKEKATTVGLKGEIISDIPKAIAYVRQNAGEKDVIFIGGSTFTVAEIPEL